MDLLVKIMGTESSSFAPAVIGGVIGFASAIFAEPLRRWIFSPRLVLSFEDSIDYRSRTPEMETRLDTEISAVPMTRTYEAEYIRIKVTNEAQPLAKGCRAYLVGIEKKQTNGDFKPTIYSDSIPLAWSCSGDSAYKPIDIPKGVAQFIDVISVRQIENKYRLEIHPLPQRYLGFLHDTGTFRLTVQVSGENIKPVFIKIQFTWNGEWDNYHAQPDE